MISELIKNRKILIGKAKKTGFFSIFLSSIFSKVLVFLGGVILVRVLSKSDYGIYNYMLNILAMLCLFNDCGASNMALQYMTESFNDKNKQSMYLRYAIKIAIVSGIISSVMVFLSPFFYPIKLDYAKNNIIILSLVPMFIVLYNFIPVILRVNFDNKRYSIYQVIITLSHYFSIIVCSLLFGLIGAVISNYIYYLIIIIVGYFFIKKYLINYKTSDKLSKSEKKEIFKFSFGTQINNTIGELLIIIDTFLVGLLISTPESIASYKIGSTIPQALAFLPSCVIIYVLPYFIKNNKNIAWLKNSFNDLIKYGLLFYGCICFLLILLSKFIIVFLYGKAYTDSIIVFILLIISFFFSATFKIPCSNITYSLKKIKFNLFVNILSIIFNIVSNWIFINIYGFIGAALTTMIINILSSIIYYIFVSNLLKKGV